MKGATVNRELACLHCIFQFARKRKCIGENPTSGVKRFNERIDRPSKRMLIIEGEHRILEAAPPHLRVAIVPLIQTGGRTYSAGLSLRWDLNAALEAGWSGFEIAERILLSEIARAHELAEHPVRRGRIVVLP